MARNFLAYPFAPYQGTLSSKAFNDKRGQMKGLMVGLNIIWSLYLANGQLLGSANPNFTISCNINSAGPNTVSQGWTIESVYIDNQNVNFPVYILFPSTGFAISCPPNSAGWYQVFTLDRNALISGLGIPNIDIANNVRTNVFFTDTAMVPYLDQEQQSAVQYGLASPLVTLGSSGGGLTSIGVTAIGSCYAGGGLAITGGGGNGAVAHGVLDQYGRWLNVVIDNPGTGYTGFPVITPTAGFTPVQNWASGAAYGGGSIVQDGGFMFQSTATFTSFTPPSGDPAHWLNLQTAVFATATFNSAIAPISGGASISASSNYGAAALGDQSQNLLSTFNAAGVMQSNLWGTPFGSGFIYLRNICVKQLAGASVNSWQLEDTTNDVLYNFQSMAGLGELFSLQGCNVKIPATSTWRLRCTGAAGSVTASHGWAWTYAQQ